MQKTKEKKNQYFTSHLPGNIEWYAQSTEHKMTDVNDVHFVWNIY
jgi:hypothetical protein